MKLLNSLLRPRNRHNLVVVVLMMLYILFDVKTPKPLASLFDSVLGNVVVAGFAISLFMRGHTVVGVLGLVAAYVFGNVHQLRLVLTPNANIYQQNKRKTSIFRLSTSFRLL